MALDKKQIVHFKRMLKEAQKKERFFAYIQEGEDGEPVLFMDKKLAIVNKEGREARKTARKKVMVVGTIKPLSSMEWAFVSKKAKDGKLPRSLKQVFGKDVPQLKKCQCLKPDEFEELTAAPATEDAPADADTDKGDGSKEAKALEKKINKTVDQLKADPSKLSDKALDTMAKRIGEYKGDTDFSETLKLVKKTKSLRTGAKEIETKVAGFTDMRKDIIKRFKSVKGADAGALKSQEVIIGEVKGYIEELKKLKAKYEKLMAA
jgi:hypothetical protein